MDDKKRFPSGHNSTLKNYIGKKEKECKKCGFVTFCLRVLYKHKLKCAGQLIGSSIACCYCKRKFTFFHSFKNHKQTCVKSYLRRKYFLKKFQAAKKKPNASARLKQSTGKHIIVCPICCNFFKNQLKYNNHLQKGICKSKSSKSQESFSARKSFAKDSKHLPKRSSQEKYLSNDQSFRNIKSDLDSFAKSRDSFVCKWCKSEYPSKMLLYKHFEKNEVCAEVFYKSCLKKRKESFKARKSFSHVLARKSFSSGKIRQHIGRSSLPHDSGGSARKSFSSPFQKYSNKYKNLPICSAKHFLHYCPICFEKFQDSHSYFQHQKKFNHWGKATKSANVKIRCPFCSKEFFHIRARNIHLRNHVDKSEEAIRLFLKNSTCSICSQIFESESIKHQHEKLEHRNELSDLNPAVQFLAGLSNNTVSSKKSANVRLNPDNLPAALKKKLDQFRNSCPICMTDYPSPFIRDKHFCKNHLERVITCKFCFVKLKKGENLPLHLQEFHGDNLSYSCKECNVYFLSELHVQQHALKAHPNRNPRSFVCCRSTIKTLNTEEIYGGRSFVENNQHALEYYCDICQIGFQKLCGLQRHRQSKQHRDTLIKNLDAVHKSLSNLPPSPAPIPKKTTKEPEVICCNECFEEFSSIKDFVPHRLSHFSVQNKYLEIDELNPYICEICNDEMDSHSNVQHHLFWHLQFKTTDDKITTAKKSKLNAIDKLGGQHVAKKSFNLQNCELLQEVTIGGVKKSLFTCDSCNIGFTTKAHYNVHVRKFCKMKKKITQFSPVKTKGFAEKDIFMHHAVNESDRDSHAAEGKSIKCSACNSLFSTVNIYDKHKKACSNYYGEIEKVETNKNKVEYTSCAMELQGSVAGCISCVLPFSDMEQYFDHMLTHQDKSSEKGDSHLDTKLKEAEVDSATLFHCTSCNCLLVSSDVLEYHKSFCNKVIHKESNSGDVNAIKSALDLNCALSACVSCSLLFDNLELFTEHMILHHTESASESIQSETADKSSLNEIVPFKDDIAVEKCASIDTNMSVDSLLGELAENCSESFTSNMSDHQKAIDFSDALSLVTNSAETIVSDCPEPAISINSANEGADYTLEKLRSKFSQLLYILVDDPDLMQQLGYGKELIDDVLVKVLQQMKKPPILDDQSPDLERLRKNILIFLDFCLQDPIMEVISKGKTSPDEMVDEALKIFRSNTVAAIFPECDGSSKSYGENILEIF